MLGTPLAANILLINLTMDVLAAYYSNALYIDVCIRLFDCLRRGIVLEDRIIGLFVVFLYVFVLLYF